ncbi:MAG: DnaJ domain-containing protein [Helicobacteraceae bacterium]|jgi:DnaJ-class molecular chaperone|nr:DnaJ domain-containing protein [Helicobacteraceae bacterium]
MFNAIKNRVKKMTDETKEAFYEGLNEEQTEQEIMDAYKLFGLTTKASFEEVKTQFKQLTKLYHPDTKSNSDSEQFIRIKAAYDVLKSHYKK